MRFIFLCFLVGFAGCCAFPPASGYQQPAAAGAYGSYSPNAAYGANQGSPASALRQQQATATQWDPYADVDAGPRLDSTRPREFDRPAAEPFRAQGFRHNRWPF